MALFRRARSDNEDETPFEGLITLANPSGVAAEAYRTLRTNLLYSVVDKAPRAIVLTSPGPGEGKSTTCANLGVVLAQAGRTCLILDCDLRKPAIHKVFGLRGAVGIVDFLVGQQILQSVYQEPLEGLKVIPAGPIPPNPAEILGSERFTESLVRVRQEFDYVLIDTPPVELVSDAAIVANKADGVLLVVDAQDTRKSSVRKSIRNLEAVGANVLGTVMNNIEPSRENLYYQYRGYAYS